MTTLVLTACSSRQALEDPPIITSASYQHTLYNGRGQPIEAIASREGAPPPVAAPAMPGFPLSEPPTERGVYLAVISWNGDARYMGASKEIELVIR